jgi:hypothetical protein
VTEPSQGSPPGKTVYTVDRCIHKNEDGMLLACNIIGWAGMNGCHFDMAVVHGAGMAMQWSIQ